MLRRTGNWRAGALHASAVLRQLQVDDVSELDLGSEKTPKQKGFYLGGRMRRGQRTLVRYRERRTVDGETILARGQVMHRAATKMRQKMLEMENPMVWIWFAWRRNPETPIPSFPCPNALKNIHGAFIGELTDQQMKNVQRLDAAAPRKEYQAPDQDAKHAAQHPFLANILRETAGQRKGFPFFFKKYPLRMFASETRFNVPEEMLEGAPAEMQRAFSPAVMTQKELVKREMRLYRERYSSHDLEDTNPAIRCATLAVGVRDLRNHLLSNPNNNLGKFRLRAEESKLIAALRVLRKQNFRQYWEILRDHDMMDVMQPNSLPQLRSGEYYYRDWNAGLAISTKPGQFMDPRGMSGCIETGRSRAEVARDLGLTYTRPLQAWEQKCLTSNALHFERLQRFKNELPDAFIERERQQFISHFTASYSRMTKDSGAPNFPQFHRHLIGNRILRWKSKRHGPY